MKYIHRIEKLHVQVNKLAVDAGKLVWESNGILDKDTKLHDDIVAVHAMLVGASEWLDHIQRYHQDEAQEIDAVAGE